MATHTHLPIYKVAYDLLDVATSLVKNMQRDFKRSIGDKITTECIEITVLIFRANVAQVAGVLVDSAKVEVDYIKATGASGDSLFISPLNSNPDRLLNGHTGSIEKTTTGFVHRIEG